MSKKNTAQQTILISLISSIILAIIKFLSGFLGNSYALIADSIESLTDVFSSVLVLIGVKYAQKPADKNHPYGHGKIEPLITFVIVAFLITSALIIIYQSVKHIYTPHLTPKPWTLLVLGAIIVWKEISFQYINKKGQKLNSTVLKAEAWHHRSDAISSVMAFIGISIALAFGKGFESADDWAAIIAAVLILYNAFLIFRKALGEILDEHFYDEIINEIRIKAKQVDGLIDTEKCFIRKSGSKFHIDLHIIVDSNITVKKGHEIAHKVQYHLKQKISNIENILIHVEPNE